MYNLRLVNCIIPVLFSDNCILTVLTCIFFVSTLLLAPLLSSSAPLTRRTTNSSSYVMHVANRTCISYSTYSETHCINTFFAFYWCPWYEYIWCFSIFQKQRKTLMFTCFYLMIWFLLPKQSEGERWVIGAHLHQSRSHSWNL